MATKKTKKTAAANVGNSCDEAMKFKPEVHAGLAVINDFIDKLRNEREEGCFSVEEANDVKQAARTVVGALTKTDVDGNPMLPIDVELAKTVMAQRDFIVGEITELLKGDKPSPLDYYDIYCKVLEDSGLISSSMVDPSLLRKLVTATGGYTADFNLVAGKADPCKACGLCTACTFCAACTACLITGIWGVVGTGAVGATSGTVGNVLSSTTALG
jgi:hypothetical protein